MKKKLTSNEKKAEKGWSEGNDMDITMDQVGKTVKETLQAAALVEKLIETKIALDAMQMGK